MPLERTGSVLSVLVTTHGELEVLPSCAVPQEVLLQGPYHCTRLQDGWELTWSSTSYHQNEVNQYASLAAGVTVKGDACLAKRGASESDVAAMLRCKRSQIVSPMLPQQPRHPVDPFSQMSPKSAAPIMDLACLQRPPLPEAAQQAPLPRRSQGRTLAAHQALARILNKQGPSTARQPTPSECAPSSSEAVLSGYCSPCQLDGSCSSGEPSTTNIGSSTSTASSSPADACIEANSSSCAYTSPRLPSGEMHSGSHRSRRPSGGSGGNSRSSSRHPSGEHSGICKQLHACADVALESAIQGLLSPSSSRRSSIEHGNPTKRLHASELDAASPRSSMPASEAGGCCASAGAAAPPAVAWHELSGCVVSLIAAHAGDSLRPLMPMLSTCRSWRYALLEDDQLLRGLRFVLDPARPFKGDRKLPPAVLRGYLRHSSAHPRALERAARLGNLSALLVTARLLDAAGQAADAMRPWKKAAVAGHVEAQLRLGLAMYRGSCGCMQDAEEAHLWLMRAVRQVQGGDGEGGGGSGVAGAAVARGAGAKEALHSNVLRQAGLILGYMAHDGEGAKRDPEEAVRWFRLAAEQGCQEATQVLGWIYNTGQFG